MTNASAYWLEATRGLIGGLSADFTTTLRDCNRSLFTEKHTGKNTADLIDRFRKVLINPRGSSRPHRPAYEQTRDLKPLGRSRAHVPLRPCHDRHDIDRILR